jgi:hypothetical protein
MSNAISLSILDLALQEDMANLGKEDRNWLDKQIERRAKEAVDTIVDQFHPKGWRKLTFWLREWGLAGTAITVPITLLGITAGAIYFASARVEKQATFEANTTNALTTINDHLKRLDEATSKIQLSAAAERPEEKNNAIEAASVINAAREHSVILPPDFIEKTGAKFVAASIKEPAALGAALAFVDYKSFNNNGSPFLPDTTNVPEFRDKYTINVPTWAHGPTYTLKGFAPEESAAETGYIGQDRNKGLKRGPAWIMMEGGEAGLDGMQLRNVVFHNVHISYFGAPLVMKNVYFVNCTFNMNIERQTRDLMLALLQPSPATSFEYMRPSKSDSGL